MPANKITYNQYISLSGVNKYVVAFLKRKFKSTDKFSIQEWTSLLKKNKAIDSTPIALKTSNSKKKNSTTTDVVEE